ncbi:MAG: peptide MFS transporter [Elusimicrobia bacterium]|nr:peptide MFS transporter [Elusimicrobiota bacterium]
MDQTAKTPAELVAPDKHPTGLYILFTTEMWERFSYYGMRALLVYYMTKSLFLPENSGHVFGYEFVKRTLESIFGPLTTQALSSQIYGFYTGFVYLAPIIGGTISDRWLGQRRAVVVGGVLMAIAEFMLMKQSLFFPALLLMIVGNGFFKPNISTQVGNLYPAGDHRRDRAFSIFYVGINVGATLSPLIAGTLGENYAPYGRWGFCSAGVGMILGLIVYLWGQRHLAPDNVMKQAASATPKAVTPLTPEDMKKIYALIVLCLLNIPFWSVYEQQGNTIALWVDANCNRHIFAWLEGCRWLPLAMVNWEMPATWYQSFNAIMIVVFTPVVLAFWRWQEKRKTEPSSLAKMAIGCILLGVSFVVLLPATRVVDAGGQASLLPITICTAIFTLGELYLSPVGLSLVTKLAPPRMVSMLMGMWFMSSFFGNYLCGYIGTYWLKMSHESFFLMLMSLACGAGLCMFALLKPLKKAIGHGHEEAVDV